MRISAIYDFEFVPPYLYASERGVLRVLDVRDPDEIREVGSLEVRPPRARLALRHPYLYLRGFGAPLAVIDVSNPAAPRLVAEHPDLVAAPGLGFRLAGDIALLVRRTDVPDRVGSETVTTQRLFLDVLDLARDPARPRVVRSIDLGVRAAGEFGAVSYADGRAYVIVGRPLGTDARSQLIVVDVRDPAQARVVRRRFFPAGRIYRNIEVRGDLLYVLQWGRQEAKENGLSIWRMREDADLELLGEATSVMLRYPIDLILRDDVAYFTVKGVPTFVTVDVSDPHRPRIVHSHVENENWAGGLGIRLHGERLYVTGDQGPAGIFDVSVPDAPRHLGRWYNGGAVRQVLRTGDLVILQSMTDLLIYDASDSHAPRSRGRHAGVPLYWTGGTYQWNVAAGANGSRVVVAYESIPAEVLDISDPSRPTVLGRFEPRGLVHTVAVTPMYAFVGYRHGTEGRRPQPWDPASLAARGGVDAIDLRDASAPRRIGGLDFDAVVTDIAVARRHLLAAHHDGSLSIVDAKDPERLRLLGRVAGSGADPPAFALRTAYVAPSNDGRYAYLSYAQIPAGGDPYADGIGTLTVVDLADPARPRIAARLEFERRGGATVPVVEGGDRIAVLQGELGGVMVVDVRDPTRPAVLAHEPLLPGVYAEGLAIDAAHLYVGAWEDGLLVYALPPLR